MIGRIKEIEILNKACNSKTSELIAVYGRRRIGKTYLINYMFQEHRRECTFFRFTGSFKLDSSTQRDNFIESIYDWFKEEPNSQINTWMQAFNFLKRVIKKQKLSKVEKLVLFIDEIPWIDKTNKNAFLGALGHFWNDFCESEKNIVLILCGSNSSWIKTKIFEDSQGPLYQRLTQKIPLKPFTLKETKDYLLNEKNFLIDDKTVTEAYMVFGGVAKYLSFLDSSISIDENIDKLCFNSNGHLNKEFSDIFKSLFQDKSSFYIDIIRFISSKKSGFTQKEIADGLKLSVGARLKDSIADLQECGFLLGLSRFNSKTNVKYIISDPFVLFYLKWVSKYSKNEIMNLKLPHWKSIATSQQYSIWSGFAFETIALLNIDLYLKARGTIGFAKSFSYWNHTVKSDEEKGAQIDILIEYDNNIYEIVECKFYNEEFEITADYKKNIGHF
jgi:AAA+ ATPase superfamily predicted ATPase